MPDAYSITRRTRAINSSRERLRVIDHLPHRCRRQSAARGRHGYSCAWHVATRLPNIIAAGMQNRGSHSIVSRWSQCSLLPMSPPPACSLPHFRTSLSLTAISIQDAHLRSPNSKLVWAVSCQNKSRRYQYSLRRTRIATPVL